jgi:hypothetical protein
VASLAQETELLPRPIPSAEEPAGPKKAIMTVAASMLTGVYYMLRDGVEFHDLGDQRPEHSKLLHSRIQVVRSKGVGVKLVEDVGMNLATSATHQAIWIMLHLRHLPPYRSIACLCAHEG